MTRLVLFELFVTRPVLPPCVVDGRSRNPLYYYYYIIIIIILTTAVFSYAIGSRKRSANEQFFCWCSNSSKFVTNNSNKTKRVIYSLQQSLHQHK